MRTGDLPFNLISHLLTEEQIDHYLSKKCIGKLNKKDRDIALNGSVEFAELQALKDEITDS